MPEHLSKSDLDMLNTLRVYDSPGAMYDVLQSYGYKYAVLAGGIMDANSLSGSAAVNFLKLTAQRDGRPFSDHTIRWVYDRMAQGYLDKLYAQYNSQGVVNRDINHREAWDVHNNVFPSLGFVPDAWTLNSVFNVMGNDEMRERYWTEILESAGDPVAEVLIFIKTETFMATASVIGNADVKAVTNSWRSRVDTPSTFAAVGSSATGMIVDRVDNLFKDITNTVLGPVPAGTIIPTWTPAPAATPLPVPNAATTPPPPIPAPPRVPVHPVRKPRKKPRLPPPTTYKGHPGSGYGQTSGGGRGPSFWLE
ncbi:hypothetical protein [Pseudomonas sp. W2-17]|uniref:hypothetical protein n=1 Tax=Pseudomonas sp. W2-17 TaxID=3058039 RepID=UPI0034E06270